MDSINEKIKVGAAKASDIQQDKATMAKYEASLSSAENGIQSSMVSLKNDLGIDPITEVTLTSVPLDYEKFDDADIDGKIKTAIQNSFSIKTLPDQIENAKIAYDIYKEFSDQLEDSTQLSIDDLQNQLDQKPKTIEVQLKIQFNTLKSSEATIEADKLSIEAAQITLDTVQANYSLGQIGYLDVLNAELQLSNSKNTLQQDIISYMTASMNFQNSLEEQ
jgi:outer membrane protein TolC